MNSRLFILTLLAISLIHSGGQAQGLESTLDSIKPVASEYPFDYEGIPDLDAPVGALVFSDDNGYQLIKMVETLTERSVLLPAANKLPQLTGAAITFNSRKPLTKGEALVALESILALHGA
ncbi:MAG: hypothetical protein VB980_04485, partial [Opitutales bacterium]